MQKKVCLSLLMASCFSLAMHADKVRTFYDEKADIIGISGEASKLLGNDAYSSHFFRNDVLFEEVQFMEIPKNASKEYVNVMGMLSQLNEQKAGLQILKTILDDGNGYVSFDRLQQRSIINSSRKEIETAAQDEFIDVENTLKDNVAPQFAKNYIFFQHASRFKSGKNAWALFRADMSEATFDQVFNLLAEKADGRLALSELDVMDIPVVYVTSGLSKMDDEELSGYTMRDLGRRCGDFAIRGNIVRKGFDSDDSRRLYADVGAKQGVEHLDRMFIYRPAVDKEGNLYSKHIATARAVRETSDKVQLYTYAGGFANSKKGDVAVLQHDKHMSTSFAVGYQNKSVDFNFQFEYLLGMTPSGMGHELFVRAGVSWFLPSESKLKEGANYSDEYITEADVPVDLEKLLGIKGVNGIALEWDQDYNCYTRYFDSFKKPIPIRIGVGYGPTWNFAHMLELMPYVGAEFEMLIGFNRGVLDEKGDEKKTSYTAASVRMPLGARLALNLNRKGNAQFFAGAEYYLFNYGFNIYQGAKADKEQDDTSDGSFAVLPYEWWDKGVAKPNSMKRDGFHAYAGLRFNF